ncbi:hypothetical protein SynNOUM97013_01745 [Synechococcus sp. NOUM97013]|nr:hypothetical protein SynNOUM97013_01745 [Synechococcus sp. NOUM97013]
MGIHQAIVRLAGGDGNHTKLPSKGSTVRVVMGGLAAHMNSSSSDTIEFFIAEFRELIDAECMPMIFSDGHNMLR